MPTKVLRTLTVSLLLIVSACQMLPQNDVVPPANHLLEGQFNKHPHFRFGSFATPTLGTPYLDLDNLGVHHYKSGRSEKNGIVYTVKAGHIDISHVREAADWTAYLAAITYKHLLANDSTFSFTLKESSICYVYLTYPDTWPVLSSEEKNTLAFDLAVRLGHYFGYTASTWHEILTWFGYKSTGVVSEFQSAFSWEDTFSNLLGSDIGALALADAGYGYNEAVTSILSKKLEEMDVQSAETAKHVAKQVRGKWYSAKISLFVNMIARNFDIGLGDGLVTPWTMPSPGDGNGSDVQSYLVPALDFLAAYGFSMRFEIKPHVLSGAKILNIVYADQNAEQTRIEPDRDFAMIMDEIRRDAQHRKMLMSPQ